MGPQLKSLRAVGVTPGKVGRPCPKSRTAPGAKGEHLKIAAYGGGLPGNLNTKAWRGKKASKTQRGRGRTILNERLTAPEGRHHKAGSVEAAIVH